ncbi:MAG: WecB/TagA/CpsF family glycosyltransferase [Acidobacteria bacterium]|nr:WecB/TagA/CpsF family glycosyltransferase [Acidobacteriota bacterium]
MTSAVRVAEDPAGADAPPPSRRILGVRLDVTSYADATARIVGWARAGESRAVSAITVHTVMEARADPSARDDLETADLVTPDGMPLVWGLRLLGAREATRVYGPDLTLAVCGEAARRGVPIGLYGGTPVVRERLAERLRARFPGLAIAYAWSPPFRELSEEEDRVAMAAIEASGARVLFVGLGSPKQDRWAAAHRGRLPAVMVAVGAAFDFLSGAKRQAPRWMMPLGLEWAFRLASEPRRLWRRYLVHNPRFVALFARQVLHARREERWDSGRVAGSA